MYQVLSRAFVLLTVLAITACSSNTIVKTYEGDALQKEQVAVLTAPEHISLVSVNGKRVPKYLLTTINVNYGLKPGVNVVVFEYESVWAKAAVGAEDSRSELVSSGRKEVVIDAKAGQAYSFDFAQVENVREARALANSFKADIVDGLGKVVSTSAELGSYQPAAPAQAVATAPSESVAIAAAPAASPVAQPAVVAAAPSPSNTLPPLEGMKVLWNSATSEEKKAFLKWAFQ